MSSRDNILSAVRANQPEYQALPDMTTLSHINDTNDQTILKERFMTTLTAIGGRAETLGSIAEVRSYIRQVTSGGKRSVTATYLLNDLLEPVNTGLNHPQSLQNVDYAVIEAGLAVAENGAVWVREEQLKIRALPFICQHLVAIVRVSAIVPDMHHAYDIIGAQAYGFATFIAGPSKTADIEQSLVLGAHGPRSMTVLVVEDEL